MKKILSNKNLKTFYFLIVVFSFSFFLFTLGKTRVLAQNVLPLTVVPARQELTVDPGEETAVVIKFFNRGEIPVSGILKVADFIVEDKEGTPKLLESPLVIDTAQISSRFAASSWFELPYSRMTIASQDKVLIQTKVKVPADARPGGRYVALYFETGGTVEKAVGAPREVASPTTTKIAGLVYLRVNGPITEGAILSRFMAPEFSEYGPVNIESEILNRGDYHIRPKGIITVTDFLGRLVGQAVLEEQNIFPDASRTYENELGKKWMFGRFKANLSSVYGEGNQVLMKTISFWVFPWKETTVIVLTLVILVILLKSLKRRSDEKESKVEAELKEKEKELEKLKEELKKKESE